MVNRVGAAGLREVKGNSNRRRTEGTLEQPRPAAEDRLVRDRIVRGLEKATAKHVKAKKVVTEEAAGQAVYAALEGIDPVRAYKLLMYLAERLLDGIKAQERKRQALANLGGGGGTGPARSGGGRKKG